MSVADWSKCRAQPHSICPFWRMTFFLRMLLLFNIKLKWASFSLFLSFQWKWHCINKWFITIRRWLDSNWGPLGSWATILPNEPLQTNCLHQNCVLHHGINQYLCKWSNWSITEAALAWVLIHCIKWSSRTDHFPTCYILHMKNEQTFLLLFTQQVLKGL